MKFFSTSLSLRQRLSAPLQRLQWKLTLSYTLVTVGAILSLELLLLALSASFYLLSPEPVAFDIVGPMLAILAVSTVVVLLLAGSVGAVFGFITARGLSSRLAQLANTTSAWSQGDFSAVAADVSQDELGQLTRRLNQMAEQLHNLLVTRRELAVIEERNRLARDLHDSAKQQAFAASAQIGAARTLISRDPVSADRHLAEAEGLLDTLREELRALILELRPAGLGQRGLATALQDYAADWSRQTGIDAVLHMQNERSLPLEIEQALFRIVQEALANTARHSHAQHADLRLNFESTCITLTITDDGQGFDMATPSAGFGLHSMRDRAEVIGAQMNIESRPAEGTRITVICPLGGGTEKS